MIWFLLLTLVASAFAGYEHEFDGDIEIPMFVGTPPQGPFSFVLDPLLSYERGARWPYVSDLKDGGVYDSHASKTFEFLEDGEFGHSFRGTDVFKLGGLYLPRGNLTVLYKMGAQTAPKPKVGMAVKYGKLPETFMDKLLESLGESRSIVLAIKESKSNSGTDYHHSGSIVFGEQNPKVCETGWTSYNSTIVESLQMAFRYYDIVIDKYRNKNPGDLVFDATSLQLDKQTYEAAIQQLGADPQTKQISCELTTPISIGIGGLAINISPHIYTYRNDDDECFFRGYYILDQKTIRLPLSVLSGWCLRYDFENSQTSLAPRATFGAAETSTFIQRLH